MQHLAEFDSDLKQKGRNVTKTKLFELFLETEVFETKLFPVFFKLTGLIREIKTAINQNKNRFLVVIIHCLDGKNRTGMFSLMFKILEDWLDEKNKLRHISTSQLIVMK